MANIGLIGGVNPNAGVYDLVQQFMQLERTQMNRLESQKAEIQGRGTMLTELRTHLSALRSAVSDFRWGGSSSPVNSFTATSSNTSIANITPEAGAADGQHTLLVQAIARSHSMASLEFSGDETTTLAGTHTLQLTQADETFDISVTVGEEDTNHQVMLKVVDAINLSGADVTATLAQTDSRSGMYRILLSGGSTGTDNIIGGVQDSLGTLAVSLGLAGESSLEEYSANTVQQAADAEFTVDGLAFVSSSNNVDGALTGVVLNLLSASEATVTLTIERDIEAVQSSVEEFITAYNTVVDYVREKTQGADSEGQGRGLFTGNTLFMTLRTHLRTAVMGEVPNLSDPTTLVRLSQIGISASREGNLSISDEDAFTEALQMRPQEVERLFSDADGGVAVRMVEEMDRYVGAGGLVASHKRTIQSHERLLTQQIAREETRLQRREQSLARELAELQNMMSQLSQQQQYISILG
ncbi:flagellar filament capping protein FliD [Candidatus Eisenbacteria bacterium]|uniref:Flagellar hook-associated protein 2 n=1 Tax=Eiseniibacteriota bacterium TaxID=2212470 RepID=A0ABV6YKI2_UNCEI